MCHYEAHTPSCARSLSPATPPSKPRGPAVQRASSQGLWQRGRRVGKRADSALRPRSPEGEEVWGNHGSHRVDTPEGSSPQPWPHAGAGNSWYQAASDPVPCLVIPTPRTARPRHAGRSQLHPLPPLASPSSSMVPQAGVPLKGPPELHLGLHTQ